MIKFTYISLFLSAIMFFFADVTNARGFGIWGVMFLLTGVTPVFILASRGKP